MKMSVKDKLAHIEQLTEPDFHGSGLDEIITYLGDPSPKVRFAAVEALGDLNDDLATEPLMDQYLLETRPKMKDAIIIAISALEDERATDLIREIIADKKTNDEVLYSCLLSLTTGETLPEIEEIAESHEDERYRRLAQEALDTLGP